MLQTIITPGLALNTYLLIDPKTHKGIVVDPPRDVTGIMSKIKESKADIIGILETHVHADFISGSKELKHRLHDVPLIYCSALGNKEWIPSYDDIKVNEGFEIDLGSLTLQAKHTPGHTPEHLMWIVLDENKNPKIAFTGDFLFVGSIGRPDLLGKQNLEELSSKLYDSVFNILPILPDTLEIFPAHGAGSLCGKGISPQASSTLGSERKNNPYLQHKPKHEWIEFVLKNMPPAPTYFEKMKKINVEGPNLLHDLNTVREIKTIHPGLLVDLRSKEAFAKQHFAGSINVPYGPSFIYWAPIALPYDQNLILIGEDQKIIHQAISNLRLVGLDNIIAYYIINQGDPLKPSESFPLITPQQLNANLSNHLVIDVRTLGEWQAGHIPKAMHIILNNLYEALPDIPKDKPIAVICGSGYRASIAASILQKNGFKNVSNVQGGMGEWMKEKLPLE